MTKHVQDETKYKLLSSSVTFRAEGVIKRILTSAWKKFWPEKVVECDIEVSETLSLPVEPVVNEMLSLAKIRGLEEDGNDIDDLMEEHSQELTTGELMELRYVSQQESYGGEFVIGRTGKSKVKIFWRSERKAESMEN
ncbi:hypothetical protein AVEN_145690-1 [Araneus ventricosus]|uniref:Uncharacterized protein n=1 Tax=Araneus ventricosus TaxID=182803 RepID=A0A4Y2IHT7_ARAVE|nr:hypothetical protein AVEN_145690-1 [Araneus ventricosus]